MGLEQWDLPSRSCSQPVTTHEIYTDEFHLCRQQHRVLQLSMQLSHGPNPDPMAAAAGPRWPSHVLAHCMLFPSACVPCTYPLTVAHGIDTSRTCHGRI